MIYRYDRVSTDGQSVDAQVKQLRRAGAATVFKEIASGTKSDRAGLRKAIAAFDAGGVPMATRLDRVARSTLDLLHTKRSVPTGEARARAKAQGVRMGRKPNLTSH